MDEALAAVDAAVPGPVRAVCQRLHQAGHQAVCVGGAVRDALLGRAPGDWDVATSATPAQVMDLFRKAIPTGVQHGTVTVMMRARDQPGRPRMPIEVTSFRGEGAYSDGRHPDSVTFGVPLREDLARRDFVINAIAYDPVARALVDPFGGRDDLAARRVRAVGDPRARFDEDGLRVMRAVRFAAQLGFDLDADTEAAIPGALPRLARVSWERVRDELCKLLGAAVPSRGLVIARRTGVLQQILPELGFAPAPDRARGQDDAEARWQRALARVDATAAPAGAGPGHGEHDDAGGGPADGGPRDGGDGGARQDPVLRLAALLWDLAEPRRLDAVLRRLRLSNAARARVQALVAHGPAWRAHAGTDPALRRLLARAGRARAHDLRALWAAEAVACPGDAGHLGDLSLRARRILDAGDPLAVADLPVSGADVMRVLGIRPGRMVGRVLEAVLDRVMEDPSLAAPERLAALLPEVHAALIEAGAAGERAP